MTTTKKLKPSIDRRKALDGLNNPTPAGNPEPKPKAISKKPTTEEIRRKAFDRLEQLQGAFLNTCNDTTETTP